VVAAAEAGAETVAVAAENAGRRNSRLGGHPMAARLSHIHTSGSRRAASDSARPADLCVPEPIISNGGNHVPRVYVGNLADSVTQEDLRTLFSQVGKVSGALVITDKISGRSRGFGFVEMSDFDEAISAAGYFNDMELEGRKLQVDQRRPKDEAAPGERPARKRNRSANRPTRVAER
jgi:hypothetical protein